MTNAPVLILPNPSKPYVLETDFSKTGLGHVLMQEGDDGKLHPILYGSRWLTKSERNYGATKGEFLALYEGITKCKHWLMGAKFTAVCDHKALVYLKKFKDLTGRTARMLELLAEFPDFEIVYKPGPKMQAADALSRIPWSAVSKEAEAIFAMFTATEVDWKAEQKNDV